jgi:hypothetical protein
MAEVQKQGRPTDQKDDEWQHDLNPDPLAGQNVGLAASQTEKEAPNAYDLKDVHRYLVDFTDDELKQIPILPIGSRLKQGAKYVDLHDPNREEFTAMGGMETGSENWYVPKTEVDYQLWHRLTQPQAPPARLQEGDLT